MNDLCFDQRMQKISRSLSAFGYDVLLLGREWKHSPALSSEAYQQKRLHCLFNKGKLFYIEFNLRLFFYLLFNRADIHAPVDLDTLLPSFLVSKIRSRKLVFDAHEYFPEVPELQERLLTKRVWQLLEQVFIPAVQHKYTVSQGIVNVYEEKYKTHFELIRNLPLLSLAREEEPAVPRYILYQGALNQGRGLEALIRAMPALPLQLKLAGEGDLSDSLRALVQELGLQQQVEFLGRVEPTALRHITAKAWLGYNLLDLQGLSYYHSLSNKFFDYMHAAVPSLNPPFPEYLNILQQYETGISCAAETGAIIQAVQRLLTEQAFYYKLREQCRAARLHFNWEKEEEKLKEIYARI